MGPIMASREFFRLHCEDLVLDERAQTLRLDNKDLHLRPQDFQLLCVLMRSPKQVIDYRQLFPNKATVSQASTANAVKRLRDKLRPPYNKIIRTHRAKGYSFDADVMRVVVGTSAAKTQTVSKGDDVPGLPYWVFDKEISASASVTTWSIRQPHGDDKGVLKFATESKGIAAIRRSSEISLILAETPARSAILPPIAVKLDTEFIYIAWRSFGVDLAKYILAASVTKRDNVDSLALFQTVARHVAALHDEGIIHADLKPANILIDASLIADRGETSKLSAAIKVIDFDHALLTENVVLGSSHAGRRLNASLQTSGAQIGLVGSQDYIAPELYMGILPNRAADVFSLGKLLYKLMAGDLVSPMPNDWQSRIADPVLVEDIAYFTHPDPNQRPQTASLLLERLESLDDRRRARLAAIETDERLRAAETKVLRAKQRRPFVGLALVSLFVAALTGWWSSTSVTQARNAEAQARLIAEKDKDAAEESRDFLEALLLTADPNNDGNVRDATVGEAIDLAIRKIESGEIEDPLTRLTTYNVIRNVLVGRRNFEKAVSITRDAINYGESIRPLFLEDLITNRLFLAEHLMRQGQYEAADALDKEISADLKALSAPTFDILGTTAHMRGRKAYLQGQFDLAIPFLKEALKYFPKYGEVNKNVASASISLADAYLQTDQAEKALVTINSFAQSGYVRSGEYPPKESLLLQLSYARIEAATGNKMGSLEQLRKGLATAQGEPAFAGTWSEGQFHAEIGDVANSIGDYAVSLAAYEQAKEMACRAFDSAFWFCHFLSAMEGVQHLRLGDYERAQNLLAAASRDLAASNPDAKPFIDVYRVQALSRLGQDKTALEALSGIDFAKAKSMGDDGMWTQREALLRAKLSGEERPYAPPAGLRPGEKEFLLSP